MYSYQKAIQSDMELYTYLGNIENGKDFKPGHPTGCLQVSMMCPLMHPLSPVTPPVACK